MVVSTSLAASHCRIDYDDSALLSAYIQAATAWVEQYLNRALLTQTLLWVIANNGRQNQGNATLYGNGAGLGNWLPLTHYDPQHGLELPRPILQSVVSVTCSHPDIGDIVLDPSAYQVDIMSEPGRVRLINRSLDPTFRNLQIRFTAGYGDTPASVPMPIQQAILLLTAHMYENRGDTETTGVPGAVEALLWPYRSYSIHH